MRKKRIKIPIYGGSLTIIKDANFKAIEKTYNLQDLSGYDACAFRINKSEYSLAFINTKPKIIAHECLHFVGYIFEDIGAIMDITNDEPQCYLLEWAVDKCFEFLIQNKSINENK